MKPSNYPTGKYRVDYLVARVLDSGWIWTWNPLFLSISRRREASWSLTLQLNMSIIQPHPLQVPTRLLSRILLPAHLACHLPYSHIPTPMPSLIQSWSWLHGNFISLLINNFKISRTHNPLSLACACLFSYITIFFPFPSFIFLSFLLFPKCDTCHSFILFANPTSKNLHVLPAPCCNTTRS